MEYKRIDQNFLLWLESICGKYTENRLIDAGEYERETWKYDYKLNALVSSSGMSIGLSEKDSSGKYVPCYAYRINNDTLEMLPLDIEENKIDDGDPMWSLKLCEFKVIPFRDIERFGV